MVARSDRFLLRKIARDSIKFGLQYQSAMPLGLDCLPQTVTIIRASFVTLYHSGVLRGCIGTLNACRPLAVDIAANAYAAAFCDDRFEPVTASVVDDLAIHIAILSIPERLSCQSEQYLLKQLKPGRDGLILEDGHHRATFLPTVWNTFHSPEQFLAGLKRKAGLPADYWSDTIRCYRFHTECF